MSANGKSGKKIMSVLCVAVMLSVCFVVVFNTSENAAATNSTGNTNAVVGETFEQKDLQYEVTEVYDTKELVIGKATLKKCLMEWAPEVIIDKYVVLSSGQKYELTAIDGDAFKDCHVITLILNLTADMDIPAGTFNIQDIHEFKMTMSGEPEYGMEIFGSYVSFYKWDFGAPGSFTKITELSGLYDEGQLLFGRGSELVVSKEFTYGEDNNKYQIIMTYTGQKRLAYVWEYNNTITSKSEFTPPIELYYESHQHIVIGICSSSITGKNSGVLENKGLNGMIVIPFRYEYLGADSFKNNAFTTLAYSPAAGSNLISIGANAFNGNKINIDLKGASLLPDTNTVKIIGDNAFTPSDSSKITGVLTIPAGVRTIGESGLYFALSDSTKFADGTQISYTGENFAYNLLHIKDYVIPENMKYIGPHAFDGWTDLETITFPSGITIITDYMFSGCTSLKKIITNAPITKIGSCAFRGCSFKTFTIPETVTYIGGGAFENCTELVTVNLPTNTNGSTVIIKSGVFNGCEKLENVVLPEIDSIPDSLFYNCAKLKKLAIPDTVTAIGEQAFYGCKALEKITIPNGVTKILDQTFKGCSALSEITIPESVTDIGNQAFNGCTFDKIVFECDKLDSVNWEAFDCKFYDLEGKEINLSTAEGLAKLCNTTFIKNADGKMIATEVHESTSELDIVTLLAIALCLPAVAAIGIYVISRRP